MERKKLENLRKLNQEEMINMIKEYIKIYSLLMIKNDRKKQKIVQKELKNYIRTIKLENKIYKFLEQNINNVQDEDSLYELLYKLDILNEKTYNYYEQILQNYEENINKDYNIIPYRTFKIITENTTYIEETIGLTLTFKDILDFYNENAKDLDILLPKIKIVNTKSKEAMSFYGAYPIEQYSKIVDIKICVPKIFNLKTALINVHELKHGIDLLPYIGKRSPEIDYEEQAKEKEKQFIKEYLPKKW